jgi:hypothetical protein
MSPPSWGGVPAERGRGSSPSARRCLATPPEGGGDIAPRIKLKKRTMKKLDMTKEMDKFKEAEISKWPEMLREYDRETLQDMTALLIAVNFYVQDNLSDVIKVVNWLGEVK